MAWKFKRPESENWWIGYRLNGRQYRRSIGTTDEAQADRELAKLDTLNSAHKAGSLTEEFFRLLTNTNGATDALLPYSRLWLTDCRNLSPITVKKYGDVIRNFCSHLNASETAPLMRDIRTESIARYLRQKRATTSAATTKQTRKILCGFFNYAVDNQTLQVSPVPSSKALKLTARRGEASTRRAFTLKELKTLFKKAPSDFWRYMLMAGFYTALRMGDLITMPWGAVDFAEGVIRVTTRKTGTAMNIPLRAELGTFLLKLRKKAGKVKPADPIWPEQAAKYVAQGAGPFSNEFYDDVLLVAGLVPARNHKPKKDAEGKRLDLQTRKPNPISFHCLRHTFVSLLKISGGSQAVAKELAGHSSDAVSDLYTHVPEDALSKAIKQLPGVTK